MRHRTPKEPGRARPLFVISNNYGQVSLAMHFLDGQEFAGNAAIALPAQLYDGNQNLLPGATYVYSSHLEIVERVDAHGANVVLLFSGYLLFNNTIPSNESLDALLVSLRDRGCVVVTSDPFLGLPSEMTPEFVGTDAPFDPARVGVMQPLEFTVSDLARASEILSAVAHLYHCVPETWARTRKSPSFSFFNPSLELRTPAPRKKRWLFILGSEDLWLQQRLTPEFTSIVSGLLERTISRGRRPMLIGPPLLIDSLPPELGRVCDLVPSCQFREFQRYLLESEFVFCWNAFSASILQRLAIPLAVFFFDRGHIARLIPAFYELGQWLQFGAWEPKYLDPKTTDLDPVDLEDLWASKEFGNERVLDVWRESSPTPQELIDQLIGKDSMQREEDGKRKSSRSSIRTRREFIIAGHSNIFALGAPWDYTGPVALSRPVAEFPQQGYFVIERWTSERSDAYWDCLVENARDRHVILSYAGNQHLGHFLFATDPPIDFFDPAFPDHEPLTGATLVPRALMLDYFRPTLSRLPHILKRIEEAKPASVTVVGTPPPRVDIEGCRSYIRSFPFQLEVDLDSLPLTSPAILRKLWGVHQELLREMAAACGARFVPVPRAACDSNGFLLDIYAGDFAHGNHEFGRLLLDRALPRRDGKRA